jgi:hypothetical protein
VAALRKKKSEAEEKLSKIKDKIDETKKEHEYKMEKLINEEKFLSRKKDDAATEYSKVFERNSYKEMKKKAEDANEALQAAKTTSKKIFDEHAEAGQALCDSIKEEYGEEKGPTLETLTRRFREEVISRATASLGVCPRHPFPRFPFWGWGRAPFPRFRSGAEPRFPVSGLTKGKPRFPVSGLT